IGAGRLVDDAGAGFSAQPFQQSPVAVFVVGKTPACAVAHAMSVEMVFRDIDADGIVRHLSLVLCLSCAAALRVSVQASRERRGRSHSSATHQTVSMSTIRPSPLREGGTLSQRSFLARSATKVIRQACLPKVGTGFGVKTCAKPKS